MQLPLEDAALFFRLHRSLMFFVNRKLGVLDQKLATPEAYSGLPPEARVKVHEALIDDEELIDAFADENPFKFDETDLEVVRSWKDLVTGTFYAFRQLRDHMVFLSSTEPVVAYGVVALFDPFEEVVGPYLPRMIKTTLLPFKGRIVYDGLMRGTTLRSGQGSSDDLTTITRRPRPGTASSPRSCLQPAGLNRPGRKPPPGSGRRGPGRPEAGPMLRPKDALSTTGSSV